ncbi:hypothetical protein [Pontibacter sp. G13]|uniref:hypothetical protein n=1 Tax=Pontibacter sp. G13 TaxID=3074898 RepID=UPI0028892A2F|nr:hypothetical protein [Pontibacter sp. G13]WNJ19384.1 hypothetical protein RJD25_02730 [Pontibacter sp. G13]
MNKQLSAKIMSHPTSDSFSRLTPEHQEWVLKAVQQRLAGSDQAKVDELMQLEDFRLAFEDMQGLHRKLSEFPFSFEPFFTEKVMRGIELPEKQEWVNGLNWAFARLAVPAFGVLCMMLLFLLWQDSGLTLESIHGIADLGADDWMIEYVATL